MKKLIAVAICVTCAGWIIGCGGKQSPPAKDPNAEIQQLIKLYNEARAKFVVQKQEMVAEEGCARVTRLKDAMDKIAADAAMSTEDTSVITQVKMELDQAHSDCMAK